MTAFPETVTRRGAGLLERLSSGSVVCAEGYLFELERRGYLQAGAFVPEVVLEHPEQVTVLHEQFVHAGSEVVLAFTYYAHREKLRMIGKSDLLEPLNRQAVRLARAVADRHCALLAGNVCNTNVYAADPATQRAVRGMFDEQVGWTLDEGADYIVGETFRYAGEALLALAAIREAGLPAVITLVPDRADQMRDGGSVVDACRRLADAGADVVGLNCIRGPATMLPLAREIVDAVDVPVAAVPVPYRTTPAQPTMHALRDPVDVVHGSTGIPFPTALDPFTCNRYEVADFTAAAADAGVRYFGLCCGAAPHHIRAMAEALGRTTPASRYTEDMSKHVYLGSDPTLVRQNQDYSEQL